MKTLKFIFLFIPLALLIICCEDDGVNPVIKNNDNDSATVGVRKPNIYIYPSQTEDIKVEITFPQGGHFTESIPEYNSGWDVNVEPTGMIDDIYEFLYYECNIPDKFQREYGWNIKGNEAGDFFSNNMKEYGFNKKEISDFLEYWIPLLLPEKEYMVYPQLQNDIDFLIKLNVKPVPEVLFRLYYVIEEVEYKKDVLTPQIVKFSREGYVVAEWGGVLK